MSADIKSRNDTETSTPTRLVTANQVVAWNIAWLRREAGLTQEALAERLGWPQNKVSEAERSWNGKRTREFDAQTLIGLAMALGVPMAAFLLPPMDDSAVYVIRPPGQEEDCDLGDMLAYSITDLDEDTSVMGAYRQRLLSAVGKYLGEDWRREVARWLKRIVGAERVREAAFRLRGLHALLTDLTPEVIAWAEALEDDAGEEDEEGDAG
jgi:transcriptional regulator with XRE-family HTH domain